MSTLLDHRGQPLTRARFPRTSVRKFEAGALGRLTSSWTTHQQSINAEIYHSLKTLRARSRDLQQNNEYAKHFLNLLQINIVGPKGVGFQSRAKRPDGTLDVMDNDRIEDRWRRWTKPGQCDVTRRLSFRQLERLFIEGLARDGEVLMRKVRGFDNEFGYALELIDVDRLDVDLNQLPRAERGRIIMGVELDDWGAPAFYHISNRHPDNFQEPADPIQRAPIPAQDIIHAFIPMRPNQVRGVPWMHAGMRALRDLGGYREAAIIAARVGASKLGFWTSEDGQSAPYDDKDATGNLIQDAEPGTFHQVPAGVELSSWSPEYPHEQFDTFNKAVLRGLAGAFGVAYFNLNNDLESVNHSAARTHIVAERDFYMMVQQFLTDSLHDHIFPEWLTFQIRPMDLPMSRFDKFNSPSWHPRRWSWIDPLKDEQANALAYGMRTKSLRRIIEERGDDADEVWAEMEADEARLRKGGIAVTLPTTVSVLQGANDESTQDEIIPGA